jgi:predicted ATPase
VALHRRSHSGSGDNKGKVVEAEAHPSRCWRNRTEYRRRMWRKRKRISSVTLAVARQQQAKIWELRAAVSMARLWRDQGKRDEARELLAPVHGWFTEGFDTLDLKDAKALLEALAN